MEPPSDKSKKNVAVFCTLGELIAFGIGVMATAFISCNPIALLMGWVLFGDGAALWHSCRLIPFLKLQKASGPSQAECGEQLATAPGAPVGILCLRCPAPLPGRPKRHCLRHRRSICHCLVDFHPVIHSPLSFFLPQHEGNGFGGLSIGILLQMRVKIRPKINALYENSIILITILSHFKHIFWKVYFTEKRDQFINKP